MLFHHCKTAPSGQSWRILIRHKHIRKEISVLFMRKIVNNKQLYTNLTLSKMFRIFITNKKCKKKKLTRVYSSHLLFPAIALFGCIFYEKRDILFAYTWEIDVIFVYLKLHILFSKLWVVDWVVAPKYKITPQHLTCYRRSHCTSFQVFFIIKFLPEWIYLITEDCFQVSLVCAPKFMKLVENILNFGMCY